MIPSILGILQGVGMDDTECDFSFNNTSEYLNNSSTQNQTILFPTRVLLKPAFSVSTFFFLMFLILLISTTAFTLLNYASVSRRNRISNTDKVDGTSDGDKNILPSATTYDYERVSFHYTSLSSLMDHKSGQIELIKSSNESENIPKTSQVSSKEKALLLMISMFVSFTIYGILPAFQSYSTLVS